MVLVVGACSRAHDKQESGPASVSSVASVSPPPAPVSGKGPVQIEMRNVHLHMDEGIVLEIAHLRGEMISKKAGQPPVFDDPNSYVMKVFDADIAMDMTSLANLMNRHVFAGEKAPLHDISM